jgi:hypothetical protein
MQRAARTGEHGRGELVGIAAVDVDHGRRSESKTCPSRRTQIRACMQSFGSPCTSIASFA